MNRTMEKFGYPETLIAESPCWAVLVRPQQATLGALVVACREPVTSFGAASPAAFADLGSVVRRVERLLQTFTSYEKINHLMLMMVDPDVHFHVLPRYSQPRSYGGTTFPDAGWPGPPDLGQAVSPDPETLSRITADLRDLWSRTSAG